MSPGPLDPSSHEPLSDLDEWESFLRERYPQPEKASTFRDYGQNVRPGVREFYRLNHTHQTLAFVQAKKNEFLARSRCRMGIWQALEYLHHVVKDHLPDEGLAMIRYHSFYPAHREGEYMHLFNDHDRAMMDWVRKFNPYDLYSKGHEPPDAEALKPYYLDLITEFFPESIAW